MAGLSRYVLLSVIAFFATDSTRLARVDIAEVPQVARETGYGGKATCEPT